MATLIQVVGAGRSGTTMLHLILGSAPRAFACGEIYAWYRPWRSYHYAGDCRCGEKPCPVMTRIQANPPRAAHAFIARELGAQFVVDSSKDWCWLLDARNWAVAEGLNVATLVVFKDPVSLAHSYWKRGKGLWGWRRVFLNFHNRLRATGVPFRSLDYHGFVSDPEAKLADVCRALGMEHQPSMLRFWERTHHYLFGSQGAFEQVRDGRSTIRRSETFQPGFTRHEEEVRERVEQDAAVRTHLQALREREVSGAGPLSPAEARAGASLPFPAWYYALRVKQAARRWSYRLAPRSPRAHPRRT